MPAPNEPDPLPLPLPVPVRPVPEPFASFPVGPEIAAPTVSAELAIAETNAMLVSLTFATVSAGKVCGSGLLVVFDSNLSSTAGGVLRCDFASPGPTGFPLQL